MTANPRILTIHGGSSRIKFALFEAGDPLRRMLECGMERIGLPEEILSTETFHRRCPDLPRVARWFRVVLAHLGNGASLAAVRDGKSVDTSLSFTPAAGVPMSTRSGDLDPGLLWYLERTEGLDARGFNEMVNFQSGLLGVAETSSDMPDLLDRVPQDVRAAEAVALFCYQFKKWAGAFAAAGRVAVRVIRMEEERIIAETVCGVLGLG